LARDSNQGVDWKDANTYVFDTNIESWAKKFDQSDLVTIEMLDGDHHFFVEDDKAKATAKLISDFIDSK